MCKKIVYILITNLLLISSYLCSGSPVVLNLKANEVGLYDPNEIGYALYENWINPSNVEEDEVDLSSLTNEEYSRYSTFLLEQYEFSFNDYDTGVHVPDKTFETYLELKYFCVGNEEVKPTKKHKDSKYIHIPLKLIYTTKQHEKKFLDKNNKPLKFLSYSKQTENTISTVIKIIKNVLDTIDVAEKRVYSYKDITKSEYDNAIKNPGNNNLEKIHRYYKKRLFINDKAEAIYDSHLSNLNNKFRRIKFKKIESFSSNATPNSLTAFYILLYTVNHFHDILRQLTEPTTNSISNTEDILVLNESKFFLDEIMSPIVYCINKLYNESIPLFNKLEQPLLITKEIESKLKFAGVHIRKIEAKIKELKDAEKKRIAAGKRRLKKKRQKEKKKEREEEVQDENTDLIKNTNTHTSQSDISAKLFKETQESKRSNWKEEVAKAREAKKLKRLLKNEETVKEHKEEQALKETKKVNTSSKAKPLLTPSDIKLIESKFKGKYADYFRTIFGLDGSYDLKLETEDIVHIAGAIDQVSSSLNLAIGLKSLINKHKHPNHGDGEGKYLPRNYVDALRVYFISFGAIPEGWEAKSVADTKAFLQYKKDCLENLNTEAQELSSARDMYFLSFYENTSSLYDKIADLIYDLGNEHPDITEELLTIQRELSESFIAANREYAPTPINLERYNELESQFKTLKINAQTRDQESRSSAVLRKIDRTIAQLTQLGGSDSDLTVLYNLQEELTHMLAQANRRHNPIPVNMRRHAEIEARVDIIIRSIQTICTTSSSLRQVISASQ